MKKIMLLCVLMLPCGAWASQGAKPSYDELVKRNATLEQKVFWAGIDELVLFSALSWCGWKYYTTSRALRNAQRGNAVPPVQPVVSVVVEPKVNPVETPVLQRETAQEQEKKICIRGLLPFSKNPLNHGGLKIKVYATAAGCGVPAWLFLC